MLNILAQSLMTASRYEAETKPWERRIQNPSGEKIRFVAPAKSEGA